MSKVDPLGRGEPVPALPTLDGTILARHVVHWREGAVEDFDSYVTVAWQRLLRSAWLLTGDWHRAEDLLQTVLAKAYGRWGRLRDDAPDAYLRAMLASTYLTWWRRRWRGELPTGDLPETVGADRYGEVDLRQALGTVLAQLPHRQRAVLMLRYHADLTEAQTARVLGMSVGTVKSCTSRALARLRADPRLRELVGDAGGAGDLGEGVRR